MGERTDFIMHIKVSCAQWDTHLSHLSKGRRSAYIREAVMAYLMEHQQIKALPLEEPAGEPIRPNPIQVIGNDTIQTWMEAVPLLFRSYLVRHCLRWHEKRQAATDKVSTEQPTFFDQRRTGTDA